MDPPDQARQTLVVTAIRLLWATIGLSAAAGGVAVVVGVIGASPVLGGFGVNAAMDTGLSSVLVWRFVAERRGRIISEQVERRILRVAGVALLAFALSIGIGSVAVVLSRSRPNPPAAGLASAAASVALLPILADAKIRIARMLGSAAFRADGMLTAVSGALAGLTLLGLVLDRAIRWWWADPLAALLIALALLREGRSVLRG